MTNDYERSKAAFKGQGALISEMIGGLSEEEWYKPSNLEGWNVLTLMAHIIRAPKVVVEYGAKPLTEPPVQDRWTYYQFNGPEIAEAVSNRALQEAARTSPQNIGPEFEATMKAALETLDRLSPETVINSVFGPIRLEEYIYTRLIELTIHGLDLALSLNQPVRFDPIAQAITVEILERLLGQPRPVELADDARFIKVASGRERVAGVQISAFI
jgi:uncharacterized protein (TIGR03083 family)